jgi:hypothetical protein
MNMAPRATQVPKETWKNISAGKHYVLRHDRYGDLTQELVNSGRTIQLTKEEREINQEKAANERLDLFANGMFQPVTLIDDADTAAFAENPNFLSEDELREIFQLDWRKFDARVSEITSPVTLQRLHDLASDDNADLATARQLGSITKALEERGAKKRFFPSAAEEAQRGITAVTPR